MSGQLFDTRISNSQQVINDRNIIPPGTSFCKAYTNRGCYDSKYFLIKVFTNFKTERCINFDDG
jgi:hypothetical protein